MEGKTSIRYAREKNREERERDSDDRKTTVMTKTQRNMIEREGEREGKRERQDFPFNSS